MWLAKQSSAKMQEETKNSSEAPAKTICAKSGERFVVGASEYRTLPVCAPYGIYTKPPQGEELLILSAPSGEICLGAVENLKEELLAGEILLCSSGGASIRLCNNGKILLNGKEI